MKRTRNPATEVPEAAMPGRKPLFNKAQVVGAALDLVEREGHEALSMRAIAARLRTGVATLYNYFGSLADLRDAMALALLEEIPLLDATDIREVRGQLRDRLFAYAKVVARYPDFVQMIGPLADQQIMRLFDSTLRALLSAGVDVERAAVTWSILQGLAESHAASGHRADRVRQSDMRTKFRDLEALQQVAAAGVFKVGHEDWFHLVVDSVIDRMLPELKAKPTRR